jgi:hypothetical protein
VHTSTPTRELSIPKGVKQQPLRNMNVNFQSIKTKQHLLENIIKPWKSKMMYNWGGCRQGNPKLQLSHLHVLDKRWISYIDS